MSLRLAEAVRRVDWIDTRRDRGFSNFVFVDSHYGAHPVMRRIFSLARKRGFQSVLIEELGAANCQELALVDDALAIRQGDFAHSTVHRMSFFRCPPEQPPSEQDFIGSAIFKSDTFAGLPQPRNHVYEALLPPPRSTAENNFIHCQRRHPFHTEVGDFHASGVLYAQQNDLTFVCAHVALRTALASLLPEGDISYDRINQIAGIDHRSNQVGTGGRGLGPDQMEAVLQALAVPYDKIVHEPHRNLQLPSDYQRHLYGCIESGAPALLGFEIDDPTAPPGNAGRHIIPVVGHTFNEDAWVPEAQRTYFPGGLSYYPSDSWLSSFVAHDDNFGPYYCLPRNFLRQQHFRLILATKRFETSFSFLEAETLAFGYAQILGNAIDATGNEWLGRLSVFSRLNSLVIRTQAVSRDAYDAHLAAVEDWNGGRLEQGIRENLIRSLPDFFWVAELSAPELFTATRHKFGELIIAADRPLATDFSLLLGARLPGCVVIRSGSRLSLVPTALVGHTDLLSRS